MKEYKKNMSDKDVIFENRKASLFPTQNEVAAADAADAADADAVVSEAEATEPVAAEATDAATETTEPVGTDATGADAAENPIEMSELKSSIEQVDAWSSQKLGVE
jgi:hypothetical protein